MTRRGRTSSPAAPPSSLGRRPPRVAVLMLLLFLVGAVTHVTVVSADLLALVVNATNAPPGALKKAEADAASLLQKFVALEGSSYDALAPGQAVPSEGADGDGAVRRLPSREVDEEAESEPHATNHNRRLIDCPNQCSNSGGPTCTLLGCAYCGRCRRLLLRHLQGSSQGKNNKHRQVEDQLSDDLSGYCHGKPDCTIRAIIQRVNADGTLTLAV